MSVSELSCARSCQRFRRNRSAEASLGHRRRTFRRKLLSSTRQCLCSERHTGPHSTAATLRIGRAWSAVLTPLSVTLDFAMTTSLGLRLCHGRNGFGCPVRSPYRHGVEAGPRAQQVHHRDRRTICGCRRRTATSFSGSTPGSPRSPTSTPCPPPPRLPAPGSRHRRPPRRDRVGHHRPVCLGQSVRAGRRR